MVLEERGWRWSRDVEDRLGRDVVLGMEGRSGVLAGAIQSWMLLSSIWQATVRGEVSNIWSWMSWWRSVCRGCCCHIQPIQSWRNKECHLSNHTVVIGAAYVLSKGNSSNFTHSSVFRGLGVYYCMKKVPYSPFLLQRRLHVI